MRILTYVTTQEDEGRAVRSVVPRQFSLGTHAFRRLKARSAILLDGAPVHAGCILRAGQTLQLCLDNGADACPAPSSLIRYIDADMLIACKDAPLATLPGSHIRTDTLRERLAAELGEDARTFSYHPVNRLDKGTSGLLCVARHAHAQRLLASQLHKGGFEREYLAVTDGIPEQESGRIDAPIARAGTGARRMVRPDGRPAVTHYRVERVCGARALLRLRLETGRTHQIRVHLAHIGCPVAGDYLYGRALAGLPDRFALHSARIVLTQPITGARLEFDEPLPAALCALLVP